uniref:Uncharacterized protein n=1 Tax=Megaviridae environmental sample TaxID=1737588 RepID=A0A5J6VKH2_9VIRU|nr:MAG: hypothetical protein [Megaviridae environmental sample]
MSSTEEKCTMCDNGLTDYEWWCNDCANSNIITWECIRCGNMWSPDYSDEACYSDCCLPMMESDVDNDELRFCTVSGETIWPENTQCDGCDLHDDKCNPTYAYKQSECKLKDY